MKECDKRKSHISSELHMIYISSHSVRCPVTKTFTTLYYTSLHYTSRYFTSSHLNFTQLHFTTLSFSLTPFKFPTAPFHLTILHCTFRWFSPHFYSFHFAPFVIAFLTRFLKILGLQGKVPKYSLSSWIKFIFYQSIWFCNSCCHLLETKCHSSVSPLILF
jgi:hypothetical protein